jgi:hypothetical protein
MSVRVAALALLGVIIAATGGCSREEAKLSGSGFLASDQSGRYGGVARWAHQFMKADEAKGRMERANYACKLPSNHERLKAEEDRLKTEQDLRYYGPQFMSCRYAGFDPWFGRLTVGFKLRYPGGWLESAEGSRFYFTFFDSSVRSGEVKAPGLVFANPSGLADFVAHHVNVADPCLVDPKASGCASVLDPNYEVTCLKAPSTPGCSDRTGRRLLVPDKKWNGSRIDAGTPEYAEAGLEKLGFNCATFMRAKHGDTLTVTIEGDVAWVECAAKAFDGRRQSVLLGMSLDTTALARIKVLAGDASLEMPVKERLPLLVEDGREERMIVVGAAGKPILVRIDNMSMVFDSSVLKNMPATDAATRERLFKSAIRRIEASFKSLENEPFTPLLQRIEFGSHLYTKWAPEALAGGADTPLQLSVAAMSSLAVADCGAMELAQARACFKRYRSRRPELARLFQEAIAETAPYTRVLPKGNLVRSHVEFLAAATRD